MELDPTQMNPLELLLEKERQDKLRHSELVGLLEQIRDALRLVVLALRGPGEGT
jgi:hypothetical protein